MFIINQDMELSEIITNGPPVPMKNDDNGNNIPKIEFEFNQIDLKVISKNFRAMNQFGSLGTEFLRVSSCVTTKVIWDKLFVTYEGTS